MSTKDFCRRFMEDLPKVIYIMAPPGGGKGTQAELLAEKIGYERFSTGDALRALVRSGSEMGKKIKALIEDGFLAPPDMVAEIVKDAVRGFVEGGKGVIFDGTPRTIEEAGVVDAFFEESGYGRPLAIYLDVDEADMIARNSKRRFCLDIDSDFPVANEEDEKKCAERGGRVGVRVDDQPEKYATRWSEFVNRVKPVVEQYREEGILRDVDGRVSIPEVHDAVMSVIDSFQHD